MDELRAAWKETKPAADYEPLPSGPYTVRTKSGDLVTGRTKGTPGYRLILSVTEPGEFAGRLIFYDMWFTPKALPYAKRDLGKIGVTDSGQLDQPLPTGIRCEVIVALETDDEGKERNRVKRFDVVGLDEPEPGANADDDADDQAVSAAS